MVHSEFIRIEANHPHWTGILRLSTRDKSVEHEGVGNTGTYELTGGRLKVFWEKFSPDEFENVAGIYVHRELLGEIPNIESVVAFRLLDHVLLAKKVTVVIPNVNYEVTLRLNTSDIPTFTQLFVWAEYESPNLPPSADVIVDLGANIGLATIFFGLKYPTAKILAVEPDEKNFALMTENVRPLGGRVIPQHGAAWINDGVINLHLEDERGASLGAWGIQTSDRACESATKVKCWKVGSIIDLFDRAQVDILKIDIEGAEFEIFSNGINEWLPRIKLLIIETHDRFKPGSEAAVRNAVDTLFEELPRSGENLFFRRRIEFQQSAEAVDVGRAAL